MLRRRLTVLLDEDRWRRLQERSARTGAPVGAIVRDAIDDALPPEATDPAAAAMRFLASPDDGAGEDWADAKRAMLDARGDAPGA